jgi:DNA-binding HxlR family transcriptional regulator
MSSYGQFCPVAKSMEVLDERWTMLVVRELLEGSTHFNDLRRGVPKMSPALLSKRLRTLERAGVVDRTVSAGRVSYTLTESGRELASVVDALAVWGVRWIGELGQEDLDPHLLLWDIRRKVPIDLWPRARTVLAIEFDDVAPKVASWWLVVADGKADLCDVDPGHDVTATVATSLRTLTAVWRGDLSWSQALRSGSVDVTGPAGVRQAVPEWLGQSRFAGIARPA